MYVLDDRQIAILRRDGVPVASARFTGHDPFLSVAGQSGLVANDSGTAVAFAVTRRNSAYARVGRESLYVLRAGERRPTLVYTGRLSSAVCERWAELDWHGSWLLYATTDGKTVAIDTGAPTRALDLTRLVSRFATDGERKSVAQVQWVNGGDG